MKKALVVAIVLILGLGVWAFAGPLTGTWDMSISIDPGATMAGDLFIDLSTSLGIDYTVAGWVFGSSSTFDTIGWSAQSFTASGVLGAFSFESTMNFKPRTVTSVVWDFNNEDDTSLADAIWDLQATGDVYWTECWATDKDYLTKTYGAAFDDWTAIGSVSIAGVSLEGLFYLKGYAGDAVSAPYAFYETGWPGGGVPLVQTAGDTNHVLYDGSVAGTTGSGFRFMVSGSAGGMTITSYTYFSLSESFAKVTCGQSLTKSGKFTVDGCAVGFTEEYIHVDDFSFGCVTFEMGLDITCAGFNWISFKASGLDLGLGWAPLVADFQVTFGTLTKTAALCFDFTALETTCFTFGMTLDYSGTAITGVTIDSVTLEHAWNGISFSSTTYFNSFSSIVTDKANQFLFLVPVTGMTDADGDAIPSESYTEENEQYDFHGYFDAVCIPTEEYKVWESFTISSEGDSCCGGGFTFDISTSFGTKYELDAYAWRYVFNNAAGVDTHVAFWDFWLEPGDTVPAGPDDVAFVGMTQVEIDAWYDAHWWENTVWAATATDEEKYAEGLHTGAIYEKAASDQLFQWVSTNVDVSYGLSSTWSLLFGLDIDVYGWNSLDFGFEFAF